jgi:hypothetical protein
MGGAILDRSGGLGSRRCHARDRKHWRWLWVLATILLISKGTVGALGAHDSKWHGMGSAPCAWGAPLRGQDNKLDVSATIRDLKNNGFDCMVQVVGSAPPNSFEDLKRLLPAAQVAGISVWPVLIPPTEGGDSLPYRTDYLTWMKTLARLSLKYSSLRGVNIDDLLIAQNANLFTHAYLCSLYQAKQRINPKFLFVPTVYDLGPPEANRLGGCVDGVWFWWVNLEKTDGWTSLLEDSRVVVGNRFPVYGGVYAHSTSWHKQGNPAPIIMKQALEIACRDADGAVIWELPLAATPANDPLLAVARSFAAGGSADLAGRCGLASTSPHHP